MSLGLLFPNPPLAAQDLALTEVRLDAEHRPVIRFTADPEHYFILYRGDDLTQLAEPVDVVLGDRTDEVRDPASAIFDARFYRVQKVPIPAPLDLDGDGIDDVYELQRAPLLHPLRSLDAFEDFDADYRTNLDEYRQGTDPFLSDIRPPSIIQPVSATSSSILQLTGTGTPGRYVRVEGGAALATNRLGADGSFSVDVALAPNRLNRLLVSTVDADAGTSIGHPIEILQDSQPPTLFLDFPTNSMTLSASEITVAGRVGDSLSGYQGLSVWVHSSPTEGPSPLPTTSFPADSPLRATVDVGIGPNGTFERGPVPLAEGDNTLTVVSTDALGNRTMRQASVARRLPQGPHLAVRSGDRQTTNALRRLPQPLVVHARQGDGSPLADAVLVFEITRSDGRLLPVTPQDLASDWTTQPNADTNGAMRLELRTGATGAAEVWWTLGSDAGRANNRVRVTGAGIDSEVFLCASAIGHPARQINIGSGNHQKAEANALAPEPLRAWVSDGLNPAAGIPVTFRVVQGGGRLVPGGRDGTPRDSNVASSPAGVGSHALPGLMAGNDPFELTVLTGVTGHASIGFVAGPSGGLNLIEASFPGQSGLPATFTVYGLTRDLTRSGTFAGLVLDNSSCPVGGAYCELEVANYRVGTFTDLQGRFEFDQVPGGMGHLHVNGATATNLFNMPVPTNSFPSLHYSVVTVANAENALPAPVLLPRLNPRNAHAYAGTNDLVLTVEGMDGLRMIIAANSMKHPDGTRVTPERPAVVSLDQVHHDDVPMPMPDGVAPPFAWTLQPGGATFDPPVRVQYPNMSGLAPGSIAYFLSFNHDTERFEIVSSGSVTPDGSTIVTDPGSGLTLAGWGCNCPPYSVTGDCEPCPNPPIPVAAGMNNDSECGCTDARIAAARASLRLVAQGFDLLPPFTGSSFAFNHLTHFLDGIGSDNYYGNLDAPVQHIMEHPNFLLIHEAILTQAGTAAFRANAAGQSQASGFRRQFGGISFYPIGLGKLPGTQLAAAVGALSEGFTVTVTDIHIANGRFMGQASYSMRDRYDFDDSDCKLSGPDALACFLQKCPNGGVKPYYNHFEFTIPFDLPISPPNQARSPRLSDLLAASETNAGTSLPNLTLGEGLDEHFDVGGGAQRTKGIAGGGFRLHNISAPDSFPVDSLSDDFLRVTGIATEGGTNRYAFSEFIQIRQGETTYITHLTFTDTPPRQPERLEMQASSRTLRIGTTNQILVTAWYADGSTNDVSHRADWTSYRLSNPRLARITPDGELVPLATGILFVTAINEFATTVLGLNLTAADDRFVTLRGRVLDPQNRPATGVEVRLSGLSADTVVTGADGTFTFQDLPTGFASVSVHAWLSDPAGGGWWAALRDLDLSRTNVENLPPLTLSRLTVRSSTRTIAAGRSHSLALRRDGTLWAWGGNADGQLGTGNRLDHPTPIAILPEHRWRAVGAGSQHTVALQDDGSLWAWGVNWNGQVGDGSTIARQTPTMIQPTARWNVVDAAGSHTVAVRSDGTLWTWGFNGEGQLGDGTRSDRNQPGPIHPGARWRAVAAGGLHTVALREDGSVWAWGNNQFGQLGDGSTIRRVAPTSIQAAGRCLAVAAGHDHSMALRDDGTLWAWGQNQNGQIGDGSTLPRTRPTEVRPGERWQAVAAGYRHTVALHADGTLWSWGWNGFGQLGDGTRTDRSIPTPIQANARFLAVAAGESHTVALREDGTLWTWGLSLNGRLGDGTTSSWASPLPIQPDENWKMVAAGNVHTAALRADGLLWVWGGNTVGQLGTGTTGTQLTPVAAQPDSRWQSLFAGANHTAGLLMDGTLRTWGRNSESQLGDGSATDRLHPVAILPGMIWQGLSTGSGGNHTAALEMDGALWIWGNNSFGQIGDGTTSLRSSPMPVLPESKWHAVATGGDHTAAISQEGRLWAWGRNIHGQVGDGTTIDRLVPKAIQPAVKWRAVTAAASHTVAIRDDGTLWAWGNNSDGGLGDGTTTRRLAPTPVLPQARWQAVAAGGNRTMAIRDDATLWAWGSNSFGELGDGTLIRRLTPTAIMPGTKWRTVIAGSQHSLALTSDGKLWGWGSNGSGQLGISPWRQVLGGSVWGPPEP